jgi:hypothetical protein
MKKNYPRFIYHADKGSLLLQSEKDEKSIGFGWRDSPDLAERVKISYFQILKRFLIKLLQGSKK